jgi:predicted DCC family thiol-disulfide oxidoreductase YuxK
MMKQPTSHQHVLGWILYDESCGFCRRWIPFWESTLQRRGFSIAPLQADWVRAKLQLSESELLYGLRLLLADGSHIRGADVYRYATTTMSPRWGYVSMFLSRVEVMCQLVRSSTI